LIERILENWLDNAGEKTFQAPFCHMLQAEGFIVVHLTRHCAMEMGKDILAIDPEGTPCAFQLKGARTNKISLSQWREEISSQVTDLLLGKIVHPSIDSTKPHRSFLVTNGEFEEEVIRAIDDLNRGWMDKKQPEIKLETIVRGQLFEKAKTLGSNLWPSELKEVKIFLEMFLLDGTSSLPKDKLSTLISGALSLTSEKKPSKAESLRNISSCALLCASAISPFSNKENFNSEIEAWVIFLSHVFAYAERWKLPWRDIKGTVDIVLSTIYDCLEMLCDELIRREHYVEGDALTDQPVYRVRITRLIGLMSAYFLWRRQKGEDENAHDDFIRMFCQIKKDQLFLYGEAAIPQFLAFFWFWRSVDATPAPDFLLASLINVITTQNNRKGEKFLANPYFDENEILPHLLCVEDAKLKENFRGASYAIEGLIHMFVRRLWKQTMKCLWPSATKLAFCSFIPEEPWQYYLWRCEKGTNIRFLPPLTKDWTDLRDEAQEKQGKYLPELLKQEYIFFILFLITFPHRIRADALRWLDSKLRGI